MFLDMDGVAGWSVDRDRQEVRGLFDSLRTGVQGLRLGVLDAQERAECTPDVIEGYDAALDVLRHLGAELVPFSASKPYAELTAACGALIVAEGYYHHGHARPPPAIGPLAPSPTPCDPLDPSQPDRPGRGPGHLHKPDAWA